MFSGDTAGFAFGGGFNTLEQGLFVLFLVVLTNIQLLTIMR